MDRDSRVLYILSLNHFSNDGATTLLSSLFPVVLGLFRLDYVQVGSLVAAGLLVNVVVQLVVGKYADRVESETLLLAGMLMILVSVLLFVLATDFLSLLLIIILLRAGSSFFHPVGVARLSRSFASPRANSAMGFMIAFGNVGVFSSFLIGGLLYDWFGWDAPFYVWAIVTGVTVVATWSQLKTRVSPRTLFGGGGRPGLETPEVMRFGKKNNNSDLARLLGVGRPAIFVIAASTVSSSVYAVFTTFGNLTLAGRGLSVLDANLGASLFAGVAIFGAFSLGRFRRSFSYAGLVGSMMLVGVFACIVVTFVASPVIDIPMFVIAGFSGSVAGTGTLAMAADYVDADIRGLFFGLLFGIQTAGAAGVSALSGITTESYGLGAPYGMMALISIPVVLWAMAIRRPQKVRREHVMIASP